MADEFPSRSLDKIVIRLPDGLRERIARAAKANGRSVNAELVQLLEEHYPEELDIRELLRHIEDTLEFAQNNNWRNNRKYLVESLEELNKRIRSETFEPEEWDL